MNQTSCDLLQETLNLQRKQIDTAHHLSQHKTAGSANRESLCLQQPTVSRLSNLPPRTNSFAAETGYRIPAECT